MSSTLISAATAVVAAFVASSVWYSAWAGRLAQLHDAYTTGEPPSPAVAGLELLRTTAVVVAAAVLIVRLDIDSAVGGAVVGLLLWLGFPLVILGGSVLHEKVPWRLAAIHVGDWLVKLVLVTGILGAWR